MFQTEFFFVFFFELLSFLTLRMRMDSLKLVLFPTNNGIELLTPPPLSCIHYRTEWKS